MSRSTAPPKTNLSLSVRSVDRTCLLYPKSGGRAATARIEVALSLRAMTNALLGCPRTVQIAFPY